MIIDVFLYAGEREALDIRMRELDGVATMHIAVEGTRTFQGQPRSCTFADDVASLGLPRLAASNAISTIVVDDYPEPATAWEREAWQRNAMARVIDHCDYLTHDTIILLSDADEIPRAAAVPQRLEPGETYRLGGPHYHYWLNLRLLTYPVWYGPRVVRLDDLRRTTPQQLRGFGIGHTRQSGDRQDAAWHFAFLGGERAIRQKLAAWSHTECNALNTAENVRRAVTQFDDWNPERGLQFAPTMTDQTFPRCVQEQPHRYSTLGPLTCRERGGQWQYSDFVPFGEFRPQVPV